MNDIISPSPLLRRSFWSTVLRRLLEILDLSSFLIMAMGIVLCIRFFIFSPFTVVWESMEPTFQTNNFVLIDKISSQKMKLSERSSSWSTSFIKSAVWSIESHLPSIKRWDVIVFVPPGKNLHYIKRVIWLPGESVHILENGVQVCQTSDAKNCFMLDESYLPKEYRTLAVCGIKDFEVSDWLFVMGDNREHSTDSRCCFSVWCYDTNWSGSNIKWYIVPYSYIIWKVWIRVIPDRTIYN